MKRTLLCMALCASACSSNPITAGTGDFNSPGGLAATGAGDRDLLFIANTGRNGLRALQLCNAPLLADGGIDPADTCPANENGQFIPAPIRVFPAAIETGERPMRVAGVRLRRPDGTAAGVALVAGVDSSVAVVDARSLVEAQATGATPRPVDHLDVSAQGADGGTLQDATIDVVAANPVDSNLDIEVAADAGATVTAFVATRSELLVLDVGLDASGFAQLPSIRGRCRLDPVVPTRLALVPGDPAQVYVADGAGQGVVSIQTGSILAAGGACTMVPIGAGGRSVRSIALSPRWYDQDDNGQPRVRAAGELLLMVVGPLAGAQPGQELDPGGVLFAGTGLGLVPKGPVPIPPFDPAKEVAEDMQPLSPVKGLAREGAFLRAVQPRTAPLAPDLVPCAAAPCTPLYVGQPTTAPTGFFSLLAAVTATDGITYFIDVPNRRFVNRLLYAAANDASIVPTVDSSPAYSLVVSNPPVLTIDTATFEPGVTHRSSWRTVWHSPIPGLVRRGGTVVPIGNKTLRFTTTPANLDRWRDDTAISLAAGDVVSFAAISVGTDNSAECQNVASSETAFRFELKITDVQPDHLDLQELADTEQARGFHPDACSSFGAVAEIRTGGVRPWLVFEGDALTCTQSSSVCTVKGRVAEDGTFVARHRRFDYPRSTYGRGDPAATPPTPPQASSGNDIAFTFAITGLSPDVTPSTYPTFFWSIGDGEAPVSFGDALAVAGLATAVHAYSSPRAQSLVFTSVTGSNEVLQADPSLLQSNLIKGVVAYR